MRRVLSSIIVCAALCSVSANSVFADQATDGKAHRSGAKAQGQLGNVMVNPYLNAPLTAIIDLGGKQISKVSVRVLGKGNDGIDIKYSVNPSQIMTHNGIPVAGLYPNYANKVEVKYLLDGKDVQEIYTIVTSGINTTVADGQKSSWPTIEPVKVSKGFENRMYFISGDVKTPFSDEVSWTKYGALTWDFDPAFKYIADTKGETRWYLSPSHFDGMRDIKYRGTLHMYQVQDGNWIWMKGQSYGMFDMMGRMLWERPLPRGFIDGSHEVLLAENGKIFLRVAKKNYLRPDKQVVNTVRDHIIEVESLTGSVTKVWDFNKILDPTRSVAIKAQNPAAVCMEIDMSKEGKKQEVEPNAPFGDHAGVGTGRNWAHINSITYDQSDDSIIISSRQQSAVVKVGRDDKVKWILSSPDGWNGELAKKVLKPIDAKGHEIKCENSKCEGDFDWTWAQHAAFLTGKGTLTVFDNGDGRNMEQPTMRTMSYSRAVEYKIDEKKGTVQQVWEFGKELGYDYFSTVVSLVQYQKDKNTHLVHFGSRHLFETQDVTHPTIMEVAADNSKEVKVELKVNQVAPGLISYRSRVIDFEKAFNNH